MDKEALKEKLKCIYDDDDIVILQRTSKAKNVAWKLPSGKVFLAGCKHGSASINVQGKSLTLTPGKVMLLYSGTTIHNIMTSEDFEGFGLQLSTGLLKLIFHNKQDIQQIMLYVLEHPIIDISDECMQLLFHYRSLMEEKLNYKDRRFAKQSMGCIISSLIYDLMAEVEVPGEQIEGDSYSQRNKLFKAFLEKLSSMEIINRKLAFYADQLFVSPKYLSYVCKSVSGKTAVAWINQALAESLRYDLKCSELSIKELSIKYDFPNLSFFGKFVKRHLGMSPNEYRRRGG